MIPYHTRKHIKRYTTLYDKYDIFKLINNNIICFIYFYKTIKQEYNLYGYYTHTLYIICYYETIKFLIKYILIQLTAVYFLP